MMVTEDAVYLLDVNVAIALFDEAHEHHAAAVDWFDMPGLKWSMCVLTQAGVLRFFSHPKTGDLSLAEATLMLAELTKRPGYRFAPVVADWENLTRPFSRRLHGHRQITDALLLGLAIHEGLVLATFDRGLLHLAGEHRAHVHLLA